MKYYRVASSAATPVLLTHVESSVTERANFAATPTMAIVQTYKPFSKEVVAQLELFYSRGTTGRGKRHSADLEMALTSTDLQLAQVKVSKDHADMLE